MAKLNLKDHPELEDELISATIIAGFLLIVVLIVTTGIAIIHALKLI